MGNCLHTPLYCHYCNGTADDEVYIVTITHDSIYGGKNICSLCYEQKVLEKHKFSMNEDILPICRD